MSGSKKEGNQLLPEMIALRGFKIIETKSGYNNQVSIWQDDDGNKRVSRTQGTLPPEDDQLVSLSPFLYSKKLEKEFIICKGLESLGLPIPRIIQYESDPFPVSVYEWVEGEALTSPLSEKHSQNEKLVIATNVGALLGKLHSSQNDAFLEIIKRKIPVGKNYSSLRHKHEDRFFRSVQYLMLNEVLSENQVESMSHLFSASLPLVIDRAFKLIHGDIYGGNVFLDSTTRDIVGVIDWIDSSELDDPWADITLAARWLAFGDNLEGNDQEDSLEIFTRAVTSYNNLTDQPIDIELAYKLYKFYDLLWHLRVLVCEHRRGNKQNVVLFSQTLSSLLLSVHQ